jgi:hypothetical protein
MYVPVPFFPCDYHSIDVITTTVTQSYYNYHKKDVFVAPTAQLFLCDYHRTVVIVLL